MTPTVVKQDIFMSTDVITKVCFIKNTTKPS